MMCFELGLEEPEAGPALKSAATIGGADVVEPGCPRGRTSPVQAEQGSAAFGGNVSNSTITVRVPPEKIDELVRLRTKDLADLSESQNETIALLKEKLDLNQRQVKSALEILGEANVPPERLAAKLVEIAGKFKELQTATAAQPGDDANITALKAERKRRSGTANSARPSQSEAEQELIWQTFQKLFAMLNHVNADSRIGRGSQTFRDLV